MKRPLLFVCLLFVVAITLVQTHPDALAQETGGETGGMMMPGEETGGMMMPGMETGGMMMPGMETGGMMDALMFEVTLSGDQEVPPVETAGSGSATVSLQGDLLTVQGDFSNLSSPLVEIAGSPAHIHQAPAGENGGVVIILNVSAEADGSSGIFTVSETLTPELMEAFNNGELYLNIHTEQNQGGELRGQIVPDMDMGM